MKFYLESFGCTLNQGETEMVGESLLREGNERVDSPKKADLAVIGTCVVINKTASRMKRRVKELKETCEEVLVMGCLPAVSDGKEWLKENCPGCDTMVPDDVAMSCDVADEEGLIGVLPISSGCIGDCSYCITKLARGGLQSRDLEDVEERFRRLILRGKKEIRLTCQDTASYGLDLDTDLTHLLNRLTDFEGGYRIRVGMMNQDTAGPIREEIVSAMDDEHIYKFFHIPLQSGSDDILKSMNRRYTVEGWKELVRYFRDHFPDLTLSTDVIVGFPDENEEDHERTKEVLREMEPDIVNVTRFSPRPGTEAAEMSDKVHSRIKKERSKELTELRFEISREVNEKYVGRVEEVLLLEEGKNETLKGRMDNYKVAVLEGDECSIGERVKIRITEAHDVYVKGEIVE